MAKKLKLTVKKGRKQKKAITIRKRKIKPDPFTQMGVLEVDFKDLSNLKRYLTERGKIVPRRVSGLVAARQRQIAKAVKRARVVGLAPYFVD